jgi:hypothetical protein
LRLVSLRIRARDAEKRVTDMEHDNLDGAVHPESEIRAAKSLCDFISGESVSTVRFMVRVNGIAVYQHADKLADDILEGAVY